MQDVEAELRGRRSQAGAWEREQRFRSRKSQCKVTLGKSDPPWVTPAGCDREVIETIPVFEEQV